MDLFPEQNPNPVLRMDAAGTLVYANAASAPIAAAWGSQVGQLLTKVIAASVREAAMMTPSGTVEVAHEGRTYRVLVIHVPELDTYNLYGTDITAEKAVVRFPDQNPNPVLRLTRSGRMTYANPASVLVRQALRAEVGDQLDEAVFAAVVAACENLEDPTMEVESEGSIFRLKVISVYEFDSINLYGTDITAARQVEVLSRANENLLLNILPPTIAARLRSGERVIADRFDDMAILFADVVGFTELSSHMEPTEVVGMLNAVFSRCDELAEQYRLEKIKTVGDAYMVVGGIDHEDHDEDASELGGHPADVADMALAIIAELGRIDTGAANGLQVRVGMHVGPAVAGVIGLKKFIYDVWGDAVNTASRMESTGVPGRIQVTSETVARLAGEFEFERRGLVDVKGKGRIETWFLVGRLAGSA